MNRNDYIHQEALLDVRWREAAEGIVIDDWEIDEIVEDEASRIVSSIARGQVDVKSLRAQVKRASALDREAVELYGADISQGYQRRERTARRVMHLAGRTALKQVKSSRKRLIATVAANNHKI